METNWKARQDELLSFLLNNDGKEAIMQAQEILRKGVSSIEYFQQCVTPVLVKVGNRFERLEIFLPELVEAGEIVQRISEEVIKPSLESTDETMPSVGKVLLATVQGDLHDIGKTIVGMLLGVNGFEVLDMGISVSPMDIVDRAETWGTDIVGMSALLTTTLPYMKDTLNYLSSMGLRDKYFVIIGGAATTSEWAEEIGADGHGANAVEAVDLCCRLMG